MRTRASIATTVGDIERLEGPLRDAERRSARSIQLGFDVTRALALSLPAGTTPKIVVVESGPDLALLALARRSNRFSALGDGVVYLTDPIATNRDLLGELERAVTELVVDAQLDLGPIRSDSAYLGFWRSLATRRSVLDEGERALLPWGLAPAMVLRSGSPPSCVLDARSRKAVRVFEARFPVRHRTAAESDRAAAIGWMIEGPSVTTRRAAREARLLDSRTGSYLLALGETAPPGSLVIRTMEARGEVVAMLLGLSRGPLFVAHASATSGALSRYMPVEIALFRAALALAEGGVTELDLGGLAVPASWVDVRRPLRRLHRPAERRARLPRSSSVGSLSGPSEIESWARRTEPRPRATARK